MKTKTKTKKKEKIHPREEQRKSMHYSIDQDDLNICKPKKERRNRLLWKANDSLFFVSLVMRSFFCFVAEWDWNKIGAKQDWKCKFLGSGFCVFKMANAYEVLQNLGNSNMQSRKNDQMKGIKTKK